ncbi:hypothetical protein BEP19_01690 [Ammoniphilus oxalaticus]|uniref:asparaginase n=1 Tax=Ammoniphilus oxalaticus TaxID=66863 RepID=A0A419SMZ7_9BACL|nr:asparaginase [Ammoniphilus oxalaticus]RKD25680.1 hypothetical protein BEP19_01690 [Ammoniphilus oxalaticus]
MSKTIIVETGGTIAMAADPLSGAVKLQDKRPLHAILPQLQAFGTIEMDDYRNAPSAHMTPPLMLALAKRVEAHLQQEDVTGVVVTHGTDTLEETAYFLELVVDSRKPIVVTGAMRASNELGADGPLNLVNAVQVVVDPASVDRGAVVVFNGDIYAAAEVNKVHTGSPAAFQSEYGPIGAIAYNQVRYWRQAPQQRRLFAAAELKTNIPLVAATTGMQPEWLSYLLDDTIDGVVIEALGKGNLPPAMLPTLAAMRQQGKPVIIASRCPLGLAEPVYDYEGGGAELARLGCLFSGRLSGPKARLKLMLALACEANHENLQTLFPE